VGLDRDPRRADGRRLPGDARAPIKQFESSMMRTGIIRPAGVDAGEPEIFAGVADPGCPWRSPGIRWPRCGTLYGSAHSRDGSRTRSVRANRRSPRNIELHHRGEALRLTDRPEATRKTSSETYEQVPAIDTLRSGPRVWARLADQETWMRMFDVANALETDRTRAMPISVLETSCPDPCGVRAVPGAGNAAPP
jgi:hypothetical protein